MGWRSAGRYARDILRRFVRAYFVGPDAFLVSKGGYPRPKLCSAVVGLAYIPFSKALQLPFFVLP